MTRKKEVTVQKPIETVLVDDAEAVKAPEPAEAEAKPEPEPAEAKAEEQTPDTVYLGPSIEKVVNHGTVFSCGKIPGPLAEKIKETPAINGLIVPVDQFAEVARAVKLPEGRYSFLYNIVLKAIKE